MSPEANARKDQRHQLKRDAILVAASKVFGRVGVHAATLDEVGDAVGLSKTSLYYYFKSKQELVSAVLVSVLSEIDRLSDELTPQDNTPKDRLVARGRAHAQTAVYNKTGSMVVSSLDYLTSDRSTAALLRAHENSVREILKSADSRSDFDRVDVNLFTTLFYGAVNSIARAHRGTKEDLDASIIEAVNILFRGANPSD